MSDTTIDLELSPEDLADLTGTDPHEVKKKRDILNLDKKPMPQAAPYTAGRAERLRVLKAADANPSNPAMDQLATAIAGLLKMEEELQQLAHDLVGDFDIERDDHPTPPTGQPLIPRLRSDAELLARLAIRQHKLILEIRQRL